MKISVIIPTYNAESTIYECIESVLSNDYEDFEVIAIDDGSTDGTVRVFERIMDKRFKSFTNDTNKGAAYTRNRGICESEGDVILLMDADSYVGKDWIRKHAELQKSVAAGIIGGAIAGVYNTAFGRCDGFCNWWMSIPYSRDRYVERYHLPTNNMSIKKSVFSKIGYFAEEMRTGEDTEFCFRARNNDVKIYMKSDLLIYHYEKNSLREYLKHQGKWGSQAIDMRKKMKMEFSYLIPNSYPLMYLYILPLSVLFTGFIVSKWFKYEPSAVLYSPIIFLGKIRHLAAAKDHLKVISQEKARM